MREANSQRFFLDGEWGEEGGGGVSVGSRRFSPKKRRSENRGATIGGKTIDRSNRSGSDGGFIFLLRSIGSRSKFRGEEQSLRNKGSRMR